jgi:hypothetical protein
MATVMVMIEPAHVVPGWAGSAASSDGHREYRRRVDDDLGLEMAVVRHVAHLHGGRAGPAQFGRRTGYRVDLPLKEG